MKTFGPQTEVLEPEVLVVLDCKVVADNAKTCSRIFFWLGSVMSLKLMNLRRRLPLRFLWASVMRQRKASY